MFAHRSQPISAFQTLFNMRSLFPQNELIIHSLFKWESRTFQGFYVSKFDSRSIKTITWLTRTQLLKSIFLEEIFTNLSVSTDCIVYGCSIFDKAYLRYDICCFSKIIAPPHIWPCQEILNQPDSNVVAPEDIKCSQK